MELGLDIVGITTVFKNTVERARMVKMLTSLYKNGYESIPVYAGYGHPIATKVDTGSHLCQYTADIEVFSPDSEREEAAVDFIIDCCKKYGKELVIIAIGPFTNIARALIRDKGALSGIGGIIIMGGAYFKQYADWNVMCDPEAAKIMYDGVSGIHCLGADVTHELRISEADDKAITEYSGNSSAAAYVSKLYSLWKENAGGKRGILHDPLVMHYAIEPDVCQCVSSPVKVITEGYARGLTLNVSSYTKAYMNPAYSGEQNHSHALASSVDRERVIKRFMKAFEK